MFSNLADLIRIRKKTSFNTDLKIEIAKAIKELKPQIERIKLLPLSEQNNAFIELKEPYTDARKAAYQNGATSEASPIWALPAVCESWIFGYISDSKDEIEKIEDVIEQLSNPNRPEEGKGGLYIGYLIIFIGTPLAFYFFNWWIAIIVLIIGFIVNGWKERYNGPFNAK